VPNPLAECHKSADWLAWQTEASTAARVAADSHAAAVVVVNRYCDTYRTLAVGTLARPHQRNAK
jgi:hypothetical protein